MKTTAPLVVLALGLLLVPARAEDGCRVLGVEGVLTVGPEGAGIPPDGDAPLFTELSTGEGSSARIELPGVGILIVGPSSRFTLVRGTDGLGVVLLGGTGRVLLHGGTVRLAVAGGQLGVQSAAGYETELAAGDNATLDSDGLFLTVGVSSGSLRVKGFEEYALLNAGDVGHFGRRPGVAREPAIRLLNRDIEVELPTEILKSPSGKLDPGVVDALEESWFRGRESPRVP